MSSFQCWLFLPAGVRKIWLSYQQCCTVMRFWVRVPVLSEAMIVVEPRVSTASRFFTSTFFLCIRLAVRASDTVTVASRPSGTLATMIPIMNTTFLMTPVPSTMPTAKKVTPRTIATMEIKWMNLAISMEIGESLVEVSVARPAICPIAVLSAVPTTTPIPWPVVTIVVKKQRFSASKAVLTPWEHTAVRSWASDSPVKEELSTLNSLALTRQISAGTWSPSLRVTRSPGTSSPASTTIIWPARVTWHCLGMSFAKPSMIASDLASWRKEKVAVIMTTKKSTTPRYKLVGSFSESIL
mmetsp:Transcript_29783/g.50026  ORF Transcript_29783/g.50026 Transcript_29783/m.50026 type:complete len:297 (-) Transcript_29783:424-1314(-)